VKVKARTPSTRRPSSTPSTRRLRHIRKAQRRVSDKHHGYIGSTETKPSTGRALYGTAHNRAAICISQQPRIVYDRFGPRRPLVPVTKNDTKTTLLNLVCGAWAYMYTARRTGRRFARSERKRSSLRRWHACTCGKHKSNSNIDHKNVQLAPRPNPPSPARSMAQHTIARIYSTIYISQSSQASCMYV
jgi:hypothetical protein